MFLSPLRKSFNTTKPPSITEEQNQENNRSIDWKLYNNPHYSFTVQKLLSKSTSSSRKPELENALAEIKSLRAELEHERRMRKKAEGACERLMKELMEERKAREGANEAMCKSLIKENLPVDHKVIKKECVENPHIRRGINGVEFFRATRAKGALVKCREGRVGVSGANLECQRAQLRVLMRYKSSVGNAQNLVM